MSLISKQEEENGPKNSSSKNTPSSKQDCIIKTQERTAVKYNFSVLSQSQNIRIRNQIFALFKNEVLKGKIKVQQFQDLSSVEVTFYHKIYANDVQQNIRLIFSTQYPIQPPKLEIHSCNLTNSHPHYIVPNFLTMNELLSKQIWTVDINMPDVLAKIYITIDDFHQSQIQRLYPKKQTEQHQMSGESFGQSGEKQEEVQLQKIKKQRRKSSNMTGCADKELTETKNLNRHFRSKLRQVLRDMIACPEDDCEDSKFIDAIFIPNRVGFEDIRKALNNKWFNEGVRKQMNSGQFLHKILRGMMGIKSKKLMIKYYHVMVSAVEEPSSFIRWKYD